MELQIWMKLCPMRIEDELVMGKSYLQYPGSVALPRHVDPEKDPALYFDADPDPAFQFGADANPAFQFDADPDPAFCFDADPGPVSQIDADLCRLGLSAILGYISGFGSGTVPYLLNDIIVS